MHHADLRNASDVDALPASDWLIDAAANPSVLAGVSGVTSSRQLVEHNLAGTINLLEYCKRYRAGFILLSTSRVYSIPLLSSLKVQESGEAYRPVAEQDFPNGRNAQHNGAALLLDGAPHFAGLERLVQNDRPTGTEDRNHERRNTACVIDRREDW